MLQSPTDIGPTATGDPAAAQIHIVDTTAGSTLQLGGSIDARCAGELHRAAIELSHGACSVSADLTAVRRLDASALQILAALSVALERQGRALRIDAPESLRAALSLADLEPHR